MGAPAGEVKRTQVAFFGSGNGKDAGLVSDGMLNTGGMSHFGSKKNWELICGSWVPKSRAAENMTEDEELEAQAVKHFVWLSRVGSNHKLMKKYTTYFKSTEGLLKYLQSVRVRFARPCACFPASHLRIAGVGD